MTKLKQFFDKALKIQAQRQAHLSEAEKKEIAQSLGFSEADWQAILDSFEGHVSRAEEFLKRQNYPEAVAELNEALLIRPEDALALAMQARAYLGLFQAKSKASDKAQAIALARASLKQEPRQSLAHQVLDAFNETKPRAVARPRAEGTGAIVTSSLLLVVATILAFLLGIGFLFHRESAPQSEDFSLSQVSEQVAAEPMAPITSSSSSSPKGYTESFQDIGFKLDLEPKLGLRLREDADGAITVLDAQGQGLFVLRPSLMQFGFREYPAKGAEPISYRPMYKIVLEAEILAKGVQRSQLRFRPSFVQKDGQPFPLQPNTTYAYFNYVPHDFIYEPGDRSRIELNYAAPNIQRADKLPFEPGQAPAALVLRLEVLKLASSSQAAKRERLPIETAQGLLVTDLDFELIDLALREQDPNETSFFLGDLVLQIENKHNRPLKKLELRFEFQKPNGERVVLGEENVPFRFLGEGDEALKPQQALLKYSHQRFKLSAQEAKQGLKLVKVRAWVLDWGD